MKWLFALASAAALVPFMVLSVSAQTAGTGTITGTVTDSSTAIIRNAPVVITDTDTGVTRSIATDNAGAYTATFLQPGNYEVVVGGGSFARIDHQHLVLTVGQTLTVDAALSAGSVTTGVTVTTETPILDPQKTEVSQTLDSVLVANLPVATRNWSNFVLLTPNVTQDGGSGLISFHGISGLYNENYVDGANNNQMLFSEARGRAAGAPFIYSVDSIKEFQAESSNYSVEFGQAAGGQVNAITRNGTNTLHGDLFYELRYPSLNPLDPYTKYVALHNTSNPVIAGLLLTQTVHQQQEFGGSAGGPILKDRLFYFFTYDGFRRAGRALYSDSNTLSLTPALTTSTTTITPQQCPSTITGHPANPAVLDSTAGAPGTQCYNGIAFLIAQSTAAPSRFAKENLFFPRLDWHINNRNNAFLNFNFVDYDSTYGYSSSNTFTNNSPSSNGSTSYHERFLVGALTTQLGNSSVNQLHGQWGRDLETASAYASGPSVATGVVTFGMPNGLPRIAQPDEHRIQLTDVFSNTHGHHSFKFGGDVNLVHEVMINLFQGGGIYSYGGATPLINFQSWIQDAFAGQPGDTDPYAGYRYTSFVQTVDTVNTAAGTQGKDDFWIKMYDAFVEESWKLTPSFTLTAGLRYDIQLTPPPGAVNTSFPPVSTKYSTSIKNVTNRIQPRIGFAWSPRPSTVVRGGYGLYSALNQGGTYYDMRVENGVVQVNHNYSGCTGAPTTPTATGPAPCPTVPAPASLLQYPNVPFPVTGPPLSGALHPIGGAAPAVSGPAYLGAQSFHGLDPNFVPPLAHEFNLSIEQAIPGKLSLQVGYVGTRATHLPVFVDANLIGQTPHGARTYNVVDARNNLIKQISVPVYLPTDRINQSLTSFNTGLSVANTWYNSLAVTLRRPFSNGLELLANFTWSKSTDTGQVQGAFGSFYGGDTPLDPNNIRAENGPSDIDVRNRATISVVYQPHLSSPSKFINHALNDFLFSATDIASSGQPISLAMTGTVYSGSTSPSSYAADGGIFGGAISSSSGLPTNGRPPQVGRNSVAGPGFNAFDLRIAREVPIHSNVKLRFSLDAFNVLNHRIITSVNGTYSQYTSASMPTGSNPTPSCNTNTQTPGTASAPLQGCIAPYTGTGLQAFGTPSSTSNGLYTARQLQLSAKLIF